MPNGKGSALQRCFKFFADDPVRLLLTLLIPVAAANLIHLGLQCGNPQDTSSPESLTVYWAQSVASGGPLYSDFHQFPFMVTPYGPLLYEIMGQAARLFSLGTESIFIWGRILLLACALAIAALIHAQARRDSHTPPEAWAAALLFCASPILYAWACTCRPDVLAALCSFAGMLFYLHREGKGTRHWAVLFFLAAFLAKQSCVAAPLAVLLHSLLNRRWRGSVRFGFLWAASLFGAFLTLHLATGGLSTLNMLGSNAAPMELKNIRLVGGIFLQAAALPLILALAGASRRGWGSLQARYFLVTLLWGLVSCGKLGSNVNYFIEPLAAACLLAPAGLAALKDTDAKTVRVLAAGLFAVLLIPSLSYRINALETLKFDPDAQARSAARAARGLVLTDSPRLALEGRTPMLIEPLPLSYLENTGRWSSAPLLDLMEKGAVEQVILTAPADQAATWQGLTRLPKSVLKKIGERYRFQMRLGDYFFYVPKEPDHAP